jgi:hypothetical protein
MRFISIKIKHGLFEDKFDFSDDINIIHSDKNSVGKTTLLRVIIYSLGYQIPNMRGLNFSRLNLDAEIITDIGTKKHILRSGDYITVMDDIGEHGYSMPSDMCMLHRHIFGIKNDEVLENLLGAYYIDQEKGWTLLNRGKVIGGIQFTIEGLIRGLSNRTNDELKTRLTMVKRELQKYRQMLDVAKYQADINAHCENIVFDTPIDEVDMSLNIALGERKPLEEEIKRLKNVIAKNTSFKKYITNMQIRVLSPNGEEVPVNESTIIGLKEDHEYLIAKRKMIEQQLTELSSKIERLQQRQTKENTLFEVQTAIQAFDAEVSKMEIDTIATNRIINQLDNERKSLEKAITESVKYNNPIITELHTVISGYAKELDVGEKYVRPNEDYIFTSDLKSLTGAIFHKIVFAFKMSYIKIIYNHTGVALPIVLDSPSGREVDNYNISGMMTILERDFNKHQIIIASIREYNFKSPHKIEISERLLSS